MTELNEHGVRQAEQLEERARAWAAAERHGDVAARYADACNLYPTPAIPAKLAVLRRHCEAESRDYASIEKTCTFHFDVGADGAGVGALLGQLRWLAGMGIQTVIGSVPHVEQIRPLELIGREVVPAIAALTAGVPQD